MSDNNGNLLEPIEDDLTPKEVQVKLNGERYVLVEASADAACRWRNEIMRNTKLGPKGRPESLAGTADAEPFLISLCLFKVTDKGRTGIKPATVREWTARLQKRLFDRIVAISDLREREPETEEELTEKIAELTEKLATLKRAQNSAAGPAAPPRQDGGRDGTGTGGNDPNSGAPSATTDISV